MNLVSLDSTKCTIEPKLFTFKKNKYKSIPHHSTSHGTTHIHTHTHSEMCSYKWIHYQSTSKCLAGNYISENLLEVHTKLLIMTSKM